ncbi:MAG: T9SS type A sorting domain-containing protein [Bacteroidales bacterium]
MLFRTLFILLFLSTISSTLSSTYSCVLTLRYKQKIFRIIPNNTLNQGSDIFVCEPYSYTYHFVYPSHNGKNALIDGTKNHHLWRYSFEHEWDANNISNQMIKKYLPSQGGIPLKYSFAVSNPAHFQDGSNLSYITTYIPFRWNQNKNKYESTDTMNICLNKGDNFEDFTFGYPDSEDVYYWTTPQLRVNNKYLQTDIAIFDRLKLKEKDSINQYGYFGYGLIDFEESEIKNTKILKDWDKELLANTEKKSSVWSASNMDVDSKGNIYIACLNNTKDENPEKQMRKLLVKKSTDGGKTWSKFDICLEAVIRLYLLEHGYDYSFKTLSNLFGDVATQRAFIVTDENTYSYFTPIYIQKNKDSCEVHLIEISGMGKVRQVAKLNAAKGGDVESGKFYKIKRRLDGTDTLVVDRERGMELQASKEHKSGDIMIKWIDYRYNKEHVTLQKDIKINDNQILKKGDKIYVVDLNFATRSAEGDKWYPMGIGDKDIKRRVSNTHIPRILNSFLDFYMLLTEKPAGEKSKYANRQNYPDILLDMCDDEEKYIQLAYFKAGSVESDDENLYFSINKLYPNPINSELLYIDYSVKKSSKVRIEIVDMMGNSLSSFEKEHVEIGTNNIEKINIAGLNSGVYFIKLSNNTSSITKMFTVVK